MVISDGCDESKLTDQKIISSSYFLVRVIVNTYSKSKFTYSNYDYIGRHLSRKFLARTPENRYDTVLRHHHRSPVKSPDVLNADRLPRSDIRRFSNITSAPREPALVFSCMTLLLASSLNETAVVSCPISIPLDSAQSIHDLAVDRPIVIPGHCDRNPLTRWTLKCPQNLVKTLSHFGGSVIVWIFLEEIDREL